MEVFARKKGKTNKENDDFFDIKFNLNTIDSLMSSLFSHNTRVNRAYIKRMYDFFIKIKLDSYKDDLDIYLRVMIIQETLRMMIVDNVSDFNLIYEDITDKTSHRETVMDIIETIDQDSLSNDDIKFLDDYVRDRTRFSFANKFAKPLLTICERILNQDYDDFGKEVAEMTDVVGKANHVFQTNKRVDSYENENFYFDSPDFVAVTNELLAKINNPRNTIKTAIRMFNDMLNGGFKAKKLITFFAAPAKWKSGMLFSVCLWAMKFNKVRTNDPTKKPLVLYLSLENSREETLERLISYLFDDSVETSMVTGQQIKERMTELGFYRHGMNIRFMYRPSQSVDINDIEVIIEAEKNENNNEVVLIVVDYLRRMGPNKNRPFISDEYLALGEKADDLANLCKTYDIPVVTASQLNRLADEILEKAEEEKTLNAGRKLGRTKTSDSRRIIDNIDYGFALNKEWYEAEQKWYISVLDIKHRGKAGKVKYFAHPFENNNGMRLVEDVELEHSLSKLSLGDGENDTVENKTNYVRNLKKSVKSLPLGEERDAVENKIDFMRIQAATEGILIDD